MTTYSENPLKCENCELFRSRKNVVLPSACEPGGLLAIGEAPGADEDLTGKGFVGAAGQRLDELMRALGFYRGREYGVANIVRCRPPGNRKPNSTEIRSCIPWLADAIVNIRPRALLLVGNTAATAILGKEKLESKIEAARLNPVCDFSAAHPAFAQRLLAIDPKLHASGMLAIPMPHTSGLSWNGKSKKGERWSVIGTEQIRVACSLACGRQIERQDSEKRAQQGSLDL